MLVSDSYYYEEVSKYKVDMNFIIFREFNTMLEMVDS